MRRDFQLPEEDEEYLDARGAPWESLVINGERWILAHTFPAPNGYTEKVVTVAVQIPGTYPQGPLDMAYFNPPLVRCDGQAIPATQHTQDIAGTPHQRWSRHRTDANPWRAGIDNIATHFALIERWLEKAVERQ